MTKWPQSQCVSRHREFFWLAWQTALSKCLGSINIALSLSISRLNSHQGHPQCHLMLQHHYHPDNHSWNRSIILGTRYRFLTQVKYTVWEWSTSHHHQLRVMKLLLQLSAASSSVASLILAKASDEAWNNIKVGRRPKHTWKTRWYHRSVNLAQENSLLPNTVSLATISLIGTIQSHNLSKYKTNVTNISVDAQTWSEFHSGTKISSHTYWAETDTKST